MKKDTKLVSVWVNEDYTLCFFAEKEEGVTQTLQIHLASLKALALALVTEVLNPDGCSDLTEPMELHGEFVEEREE